jgi:methyl-accepting chemotaxis protein
VGKISLFGRKNGAQRNTDRAVLDAIGRSQAVIEFAMDGTILAANGNFLAALGYEAEDIIGQNHRMFTESNIDQTAYQRFWEGLRAGRFDAGEYKRIGKGGREVWIQASYNPVMGADGKPIKVVKFATDVTAAKLNAADTQGQLEAINKSQAVIEFSVTGEVLTANANFCAVMGYRLDEIQGRHHRMFVQAAESGSQAYADFWAQLAKGKYQAAEYLRLARVARKSGSRRATIRLWT